MLTVLSTNYHVGSADAVVREDRCSDDDDGCIGAGCDGCD